MATAKKSEKKAPRIRARSRGSVNSMLESVAEPYKEANPDKAVRWVLSPEHNKELSQVYKRQAQGYVLVDPTIGDLEYPHGVTGSVVRVGDLVLMAIDSDLRREDEDQTKKLAQRESNKSRDSYLQAMGRVSGGKHATKGLGTIDVSTEDVNLEIPTEEE